jgi:hypothetical protein
VETGGLPTRDWGGVVLYRGNIEMFSSCRLDGGRVGLVLCWDMFQTVGRQELLVRDVGWDIACDIVSCVAVCLVAFLCGWWRW